MRRTGLGRVRSIQEGPEGDSRDMNFHAAEVADISVLRRVGMKAGQ